MDGNDLHSCLINAIEKIYVSFNLVVFTFDSNTSNQKYVYVLLKSDGIKEIGIISPVHVEAQGKKNNLILHNVCNQVHKVSFNIIFFIIHH